MQKRGNVITEGGPGLRHLRMEQQQSAVNSSSTCSLQELTAYGEDCGMRGDEIATMLGPQLWKVEKRDNDRIVRH